MLVIRDIDGNIKHRGIEQRACEWIDLEWHELNKRILRKVTDKGREIAISLAEGEKLEVGAILYQDEEVQIVVRTTKEEVYVIYPKNNQQMGQIEFELGNRHTPCLIEEEEIIIRYDKTLQQIFNEVGVNYERRTRRFTKAFNYQGHQH